MHVFQSIGQLQIGPGGWSVNLALPIKQNKIKKAVFFSQTQHMQHAQLTSKKKVLILRTFEFISISPGITWVLKRKQA